MVLCEATIGPFWIVLEPAAAGKLFDYRLMVSCVLVGFCDGSFVFVRVSIRLPRVKN